MGQNSSANKKRISVKGYVEVPDTDKELHVGTGGLRDNRSIAALAHLEEYDESAEEREFLLTQLDIKINEERAEKDRKTAEALHFVSTVIEFFNTHPDVAIRVWDKVKLAGTGIQKGVKYISGKITTKQKDIKAVAPTASTKRVSTAAHTKDIQTIFATIHTYRQIPEIDPIVMMPVIEALIQRVPEAAKDKKVQFELKQYRNRVFIEKEHVTDEIMTLFSEEQKENNHDTDAEIMQTFGL